MGKTVKTVKKIISLLKTKNVVTIPQIVDENKILNGKTAVISDIEEGAAMAIYEVGLRANDDYETEGTH